jgi:hypothetical protein
VVEVQLVIRVLLLLVWVAVDDEGGLLNLVVVEFDLMLLDVEVEVEAQETSVIVALEVDEWL